MKIFRNIQPRTMIAITIAITILMVLSAYIELRQSREELFHVMQEEAMSLVETILQSSRNTITSTEKLEEQLAERLYNNGYFVARLDSLGLISNKSLAQFAFDNKIFRINIFDRKGRKVFFSAASRENHESIPPRHSPQEFIKPILTGNADRLYIGLKEARRVAGQRFAVAIRRTHQSGGAIVLNLDAKDLLEFRKTVGIGKLLRDLGDNSGIEYAALQDGDGIIAASRAVKELSSFDEDDVLSRLIQQDTTFMRTAAFEGQDVFEILRPLAIESEPVGILRIGLSMDEIHATEERMIRRIAVITLVLISLGALVVTAIVATQNFRITERKLSEVQTFTGNILEHMNDAVVTFDAAGRVSIFNPQAQLLFGTSEQEVVGRTLDDLRTTPLANLAPLLQLTEKNAEHSLHVGERGTRLLSISVSKTHDEQGHLESSTLVARDLTESRRLQQEVQRKEKLTAMGELASGVAHEIRNPLNAIAMIAQRFEKEFTPSSDAQEYQSLTRVLKSEAQRVNGIIQQFLRFAKPHKLNLKAIAANELIDHVATVFSSQAASKDVQFIFRTCKDEIRVDPDLMTQALLNLLQNALDATAAGGTIELSCRVGESNIQFEVKDNGTGILPQDLSKIFNLYYSTKPEGSGLGLSITHQIIAQHQGRIEVESAEQSGSRFTISLPQA